jgi:hypothetical protein
LPPLLVAYSSGRQFRAPEAIEIEIEIEIEKKVEVEVEK